MTREIAARVAAAIGPRGGFSTVNLTLIPPLGKDHPSLIFNVDHAVGINGTNTPEDVLLVQFFLRKSTERNVRLPEDLKARMQRAPLTGICDAATIDAIKAVQERVRQLFSTAIVDGRVDRAKSY